MAKLFAWDPWIELEGMQEDLTRILEGVLRAAPQPKTLNQGVCFAPVADILEQKDKFVILVELPGVLQENIGVEVSGKQIVVYGQRPLPTASAGASFHALEGRYGQFERQFLLPIAINTDMVRAKFRDGLLMIVVFKEPKVVTHRSIVVHVQD